MDEINEIYDNAIQKLEAYKSIPTARKIYEAAVHTLIEKKEVAVNLYEIGISFYYQFDSCICLGNFNLTNLFSFRYVSVRAIGIVTSTAK